MAEWSKALVLGTNHICGVGSNPTAANFFLLINYRLSMVSPIYSSLQRCANASGWSTVHTFIPYVYCFLIEDQSAENGKYIEMNRRKESS